MEEQARKRIINEKVIYILAQLTVELSNKWKHDEIERHEEALEYYSLREVEIRIIIEDNLVGTLDQADLECWKMISEADSGDYLIDRVMRGMEKILKDLRGAINGWMSVRLKL